MKFRYYLVTDDHQILGTNDIEVALQAADDISDGDNGFSVVIDTELGLEMVDKGTMQIREQTLFNL